MKGPKNLTSTQSTDIDPQLRARQNQIWNQAQTLTGTPYQPYTGDRFAGFTPDQLESFNLARQAAGAGTGELDAASQATNLLTQFNAPQVNYQNADTYTTGDPRSVSGSLLNPNTLSGLQYQPQQVTAQQVTAGNTSDRMGAYRDPYEQQVVDTSLADIDRLRREAEAGTEAAAAKAGAFGGSRHGVAQALTNREFANTAASTAAQLRSAGFRTAAELGAGDVNRALSAAQGNQAANLSAAQGNQAAGLQAGLEGGRNVLQGLLANQSTDLQSQLANQSAFQRAGEFNASQRQQGSQFNAGNLLQSQLANAQNTMSAGNLRLGAAGQLAGIGGQRQQMGIQGADVLNRTGAQQQAQDQQQRDFDYQQFIEGRDLPYQQLNLLAQILQGQQYGSTSTSTVPNPNRGSFLGTLGSIGGTILGGPLGNRIGNKVGNLLGV